MTSIYLTLKTLHIVAVISWMAGVLYFYRLFVYHKDFGGESADVHKLLSLMEYRLYRYIAVPAMIVSVISGLSMAMIQSHYFLELWFQIKLFCICLLVLMTLSGTLFLNRFRNHNHARISGVQLRIINEIPTLLMIIAVSMVIFRPM